MEKISQTTLSHLDIIHLEGPDSLKFLQGQCTADVNQLQDFTPLLGAFCTAKGRAITNMWLVKSHATDHDYFMICEKGAAVALFKHLGKYIPFFRGTKMTHSPGAYVGFGYNGEDALAIAQQAIASTTTTASFACSWGQHRAMAWVSANTAPELAKTTESVSLAQWQTQDIAEQNLWLSADQVEQWIPQNFSLDELNGISFSKGCYTGQEVVARLHYKGKSKKRLFRIQWASNQSLSQIFGVSGIIGDVIQQSSVDGVSYALAILKEDQINEPMFGDEKQQLIIELLH